MISPIYASEFGNEVAARLAALDGSIPSLFQDQPIGIEFDHFPNLAHS